MSAAHTSYDDVAYPSMIFAKSHPDRMAVIARLHGLMPPPVETARVLQIGGGDGLDAIALAAALPRATFVNFDIAPKPIARGRRWADAAGLANIRHALLDILEAGARLAGPFDYIIAHGLYAWVPQQVRAAIMPLIGRLLAPNGIAFVSYNTFPGGHSRVALREMMRHHVARIADPAAQLTAVRLLLRGFVTPQPNDEPITAAMRREAEAALTYPDGLLFHDGLNEFYHPQSLTTVVNDAQAHRLHYLGDAAAGGLEKGFLNPDRAGMSEADLLDRLQARDYSSGRYFRTSLFVHADAAFSRVVDCNAARAMWATTHAVDMGGGGQFRIGTRNAGVGDPRRAATLRRLIACRPDRVAVAELVDDDDALAALCHHALEGVIELSTTPPLFSLTPADQPRASALARMQIAEGQPRIATLDHRMIALDDESLRRLTCLLDGTRDRAALTRDWAALPAAALMPLDQALTSIAREALLID